MIPHETELSRMSLPELVEMLRQVADEIELRMMQQAGECVKIHSGD